MSTTMSLGEQISAWRDQEPEDAHREFLTDLLAKLSVGNSEAAKSAQDMFGSQLSFGTAGIRGPMRPGPNGMNRVVVAHTTAGLARYLQESLPKNQGRPLRVAIGFDGRHHSEVFAQDAAQIFSGYGIQALILPRLLPTPVLAFTVRKLGCDAGVMVTASHNPPQDNGYKVYFGGSDEGSQIIPPVDREIEAQIQQVARTLAWSEIPRSPTLVSTIEAAVVDDYISASLDSLSLTGPHTSSLSIVYTAMHGVGGKTFLETLSQAGFPTPHIVEEQFHPDGDFPTVSFPNPEEKGALDLSYKKARHVDADLIIAHDPDADRLAVAIPDPSSQSGYRPLTGNQLGAILGWHIADKTRGAGSSGSLANSLVSSPVLGKIARHFELGHEETLTGFKYVSRVKGLVFGFEEALGYLVTPDVVKDKDGISAGLLLISLAYTLADEGKTLADYLHTIEDAVGAFSSSQVTVKLEDGTPASRLTNSLRSSSISVIGDRAVTESDDFLDGVSGFPPEDILRYYLDDGSRVTVRPSGTEPKVKVYIDTTGESSEAAQATLHQLESDLAALVKSLS
ncbi:phospho-sugar mutase [Pontimonas sp.]|nr:phospho-sugar mutase [Pontimonas sp.]